MKRQKFDWDATVLLVLTILVFMFLGWKLAIGVFVVGAIIIGWKDRYKGPFPTKDSNL